MVCLICVGLLCVVPCVVLGILLCLGIGGRFVNLPDSRPRTPELLRFCGICTIVIGLGCIPLSLIELYAVPALVWVGLGIVFAATAVLMIGILGPWLR